MKLSDCPSVIAWPGSDEIPGSDLSLEMRDNLTILSALDSILRGKEMHRLQFESFAQVIDPRFKAEGSFQVVYKFMIVRRCQLRNSSAREVIHRLWDCPGMTQTAGAGNGCAKDLELADGLLGL